MTDHVTPIGIGLKSAQLEKLWGWPKRCKSAIIRRLIDAACPICGSPTQPFPDQPGWLWCPECGKAVIFTQQEPLDVGGK